MEMTSSMVSACTLVAQGYHIATSVHADTIDDVISMYHYDLRLHAEDVCRLGLVINIGLVGHIYPPRRRWLTTHFLRPQIDPRHPEKIVALPLSLWNEIDDTFEHADQSILDELAQWAGMNCADFSTALKERIDCLQELSQGRGVDPSDMYDAIDKLRKHRNDATA